MHPDEAEILTAVDVGNLPVQSRGDLSALLDRYGVSHAYVGPELQVPAAEVELVEELIDHVSRPPTERSDPPSIFGGAADLAPSALESALAPGWLRLVAVVVEGWLLAAVAVVAGRVAPAVGGWGVSSTFAVVSGLVLVAITGRTVGMWLLGMRVVVPPSVAPPGWATAALRFAVVEAPWWATAAVVPFVSEPAATALMTLPLAWAVICFGPILFDPWRRGLHDRAARTLVVRAGAMGPLDRPA